jgi:hypothetical protein
MYILTSLVGLQPERERILDVRREARRYFCSSCLADFFGSKVPLSTSVKFELIAKNKAAKKKENESKVLRRNFSPSSKKAPRDRHVPARDRTPAACVAGGHFTKALASQLLFRLFGTPRVCFCIPEFLCPVFAVRNGPVVNGELLQAVQLEESAVDGHIAHEMERFARVPACT